MDEDRGARLRRMRLRAWRRGTREMDLILGGYADAALAGLDAAGLDAFEALLEQDDHDLYRWVTAAVAGRPEAPAAHAGQVAALAARHGSGTF